MSSFSYWCLFLSSAFALTISPGPDLIYILSNTLAKGQKIGLACSAGVCTGVIFHITAAALGLSVIMAKSALAFSIVKYIGAAYLIYLGLKAIMSKHGAIDVSASGRDDMSVYKAFRQGVLTDIFNPKVAIFFLAFIPQFIRPELGHATAQFFMLGFILIFIGFVVQGIFVITAGRTTGFLRSNQRISGLLNKVLGTVFIFLGARLAFIKQ